MTPLESLLQVANLPVNFREYQKKSIDEFSFVKNIGLYYDPGLGKTLVALAILLNKVLSGNVTRAVIVCPPIVIPMWEAVIRRVQIHGHNISEVVAYEGTPKQREEIRKKLAGIRFVIMSHAIFRTECYSVVEGVDESKLAIVIDEAQALKSHKSQLFKLVSRMSLVSHVMLLTGTPISKPEDWYAYTRITNRSAYRTYEQWLGSHVTGYDKYDMPDAYSDLDLAYNRAMKNAHLVKKEDVLTELPELTVAVEPYRLSAAHLKLYRQLIAEKLLSYPDGTKLDLTETNAIIHAAHQIVMNWGHFARDDSKLSAGVEYVDNLLESLGSKKLIVFSNYVMTNKLLMNRYKAPAIFAGGWNREKALSTFLNDDKCRLLVLHPGAGGVGVDGLQHVCSDVAYMEPPVYSAFIQSLNRVHRSGQQFPVTVRLAQAQGTCQRHLIRQLEKKDELLAPITGDIPALRDILYG